ncbi:hypothetical protein VTJ49DRAFT_4236 [Mycothermus thermophilus]|uniref:BRCT domain-containing protein n=1 Tax=Humicola insolens TaxID=85995 RepID=A0ABR3V5T0_HUMIN
MPSRTLRQAEKKALDGANESQDTLLVAHRLMTDYGVGLVSPEPLSPGQQLWRKFQRRIEANNKHRAEEQLTTTRRSDAAPVAQEKQASQSNGSQRKRYGSRMSILEFFTRLTKPTRPDSACLHNTVNRDNTRGTRPNNDASQTHNSIPETQDVGFQEEPRPIHLPDWDDVSDHGVVGSLNLPDSLPASADINGTLQKKMDSTQDSTQSNVGRSYDQYRRPSSADRMSPISQRERSPGPSTHGDASRGQPPDDPDMGLAAADATAVTKTNIASPVQDDSGFVDFGRISHFRDVTTQKTAQSPSQTYPQTPGPPQNPFRNSRSQLLPTSQLFHGTQFSSAVKVVSPTSSRPSPAGFQGNDISPNPIISSPLKARGLRSTPPAAVTSSPEILPATTSPDARPDVNSPTKSSAAADVVIPESSRDGPMRKRSGPDPMSTYEPMQKSQERRATSEIPRDLSSSAEEDDVYDSIARRQRVKAKKEAALKQLTAISFQRPSRPDDVEVPSTSQRKRTSQAEAYISQCHGRDPAAKDSDPKNSDAPDTAQPSRSLRITKGKVVDEDLTKSEVEEETMPTANEVPTTTTEIPSARDGDAIPETSPTSERPPALPQAAPSSKPESTTADSTSTFQSSPPAFSTRARRARTRKVLPKEPDSTSTLSNLESTPQLPSSKPPETTETAPAASPSEATVVGSSSPASVKTTRQSARGRLPKLKTYSTERLKQSAKVTRRVSDSTDELTRSASATPTFEQSLRMSRQATTRSASRSGRRAAKSPTGNASKLFENMAFAISFQSQRPGETNEEYTTRMNYSARIQKRIKQAGGHILEDGFHELFEVSSHTAPSKSTSPSSTPGSDSDVTFTIEGLAMGFTALIADGHSRKVKYMQALALGLPCIAPRWITTCLDRKEIVDWTPYLLCAGQSAFLGDAIRSRTLSPYDAATARLADVVDQREKLLEGSRILAVVKRSAEGRKMAYVFLARVLGASLTRVCTVEEGREEMKKAEAAGRPFDWVYVDGKAEEDALFGTGPAPAPGGRKRKRASAAASGLASVNTSAASLASISGQPPAKRVRTLTDELVIQSLILGRMIEEGEMQADG